jgi:hypothetical protein
MIPVQLLRRRRRSTHCYFVFDQLEAIVPNHNHSFNNNNIVGWIPAWRNFWNWTTIVRWNSSISVFWCSNHVCASSTMSRYKYRYHASEVFIFHIFRTLLKWRNNASATKLQEQESATYLIKYLPGYVSIIFPSIYVSGKISFYIYRYRYESSQKNTPNEEHSQRIEMGVNIPFSLIGNIYAYLSICKASTRLMTEDLWPMSMGMPVYHKTSQIS